jgi:hypothetical protein
VHLEKCEAEDNTPATWRPQALVSEEEEEEVMRVLLRGF